jgi:ComF family protein
MKANRRNSKSLKNILLDFVSLFFPQYCLSCSDILVKGEEIVCTKCIIDLPKTNYHQHITNPIAERLKGRLPMEFVYAFLKFKKKGNVQHLLHQLKYNNHPEVGLTLGRVYGNSLKELELNKNYDLLIPIPLHKTRKKSRGYNQSAKFAEGLSSAMAIPFDDAICSRKIKTATQTKKSRIERWENVKEVFGVDAVEKVKNKSVILVDDVITTGATIEALAIKLMEAGCKKVSVICLAEAQ